MADFDIVTTDKLLSTTRAVRKRLDLERAVEPEVIEECLRLAIQAPTGSNAQGWRWLVITDPAIRKELAELYRRGAKDYLAEAEKAALAQGNKQNARIFDSAAYLLDVLADVPVHVIPCIEGRVPEGPGAGIMGAGLYGSIFPAVWSFQLALRSRGLGTVLTTLHLFFEKETAELLSIPDNITQAGLLPVAYTKGTDFKPARRRPIEDVTYWNDWDKPRS
jgi:nitroreductase